MTNDEAIDELSHYIISDSLTEAPSNEACQLAIDALKHQWISVEDRLPEERKWVLCQCRARIRMVLRLQDGYWHQDSQHEFMRGFVTHWRPLPEPPKEET